MNLIKKYPEWAIVALSTAVVVEGIAINGLSKEIKKMEQKQEQIAREIFEARLECSKNFTDIFRESNSFFRENNSLLREFIRDFQRSTLYRPPNLSALDVFKSLPGQQKVEIIKMIVKEMTPEDWVKIIPPSNEKSE